MSRAASWRRLGCRSLLDTLAPLLPCLLRLTQVLGQRVAGAEGKQEVVLLPQLVLTAADMGFQAVCIGYMLCKKYGVDTQNFAINRIPEKLAGKEPKDIRYELSKTRNAMADIHSRVSDELYKKKQERSKDYER